MAKKKKVFTTASQDAPLFDLLQDVSVKVDAVRDDFSKLDKKIDLHIQKSSFEFEAIRKLDEQQNLILTEHHDRSTQLKRDNDLREQGLVLQIKGVESRVSTLEEPRKFLKTGMTILLTLGLLAEAGFRIYQFMHPLGR